MNEKLRSLTPEKVSAPAGEAENTGPKQGSQG